MFENVKEEISIYKIKEDTFIKVLSFDETTSAANVEIFYKSNNKYRSITQNELPKEIVTHIATKKSEKISEEELKQFESFLEKNAIQISNLPIQVDKIIPRKILHTDYILTKEKDVDYYMVQRVITNEFGMMMTTTPIISSLIPYVFADIISIGNKFKNNLYLIEQNIFVQMCELRNETLGIIYQFEESDEKNDKASITIIGLFLIEKNSKGKYIIKTNQENINKSKVTSKIDEQTEIFMKKLGLIKK